MCVIITTIADHSLNKKGATDHSNTFYYFEIHPYMAFNFSISVNNN